MQRKEVEIFYPASRAAWREWLKKNHLSQQAVWLVFYTKSSGKKSITWGEAVEEALCFGWIDSKKIKIDQETSHQFFSRRKPESTWSKINKEKVQRLIADGHMTEAGYKSIEVAKQNGSWIILDAVEELMIPQDLEVEFAAHPSSKDFFLSLSKSARKSILQWLVLAKRPETRQKRVTEIAELAAQKLKPRHVQ
ncbi:YdeI/OmpD-associated family protein [Sabulibacter ruber]|uniref:YdeI/OmpD-associated family protein n=1 Tax=Sabulibacter ruber TaxID=2811901 RepID=UPI001A958407|nr:YdeI/OmpD-associated family protein [Sabulibacter ruber]